jgi:hypothetical protein
MGWTFPDLSAIKNNSMDHCLLHYTYFLFATMLQCYNATMLQCYNVTMLQCYNATMLQCYNATMLQCYNATMLQCCNALVQSVDSLPENRFQNLNADFVQNFSDSRKKFICRPELLFLDWRRFLGCPNKKTRKSPSELSPASTVDVMDVMDVMDVVNVMQFARNFHCKTPLSLLLDVALYCPHARPISFHFFLYSEQRSRWEDFGYSRQQWTSLLLAWHSMAWHGINLWNPGRSQTNVSLDFGLWILCFSRSGTSSLISIWQPDQFMIWSVDK